MSIYISIFSDDGIGRDPLSPIDRQCQPYADSDAYAGFFAVQSDSGAQSLDPMQISDENGAEFEHHHEEDHANCESLAMTDEFVPSAKTYTFNPLSKPFEPARKVSITSDYCSQTDSSSSTSESPVPLSDCSSSISCAQHPEATDNAQPTTTTTTTDDAQPTSAEYANENLKHVFQRFFDTHSVHATKSTGKHFVCILCSAQFRNADDLQKHILDKVNKSHDCIVCGASFAHKFLMQRHRSSHRHMKTFECRGCCKKFRNLMQLTKHFDVCHFKLYIYA